MKTKRFFEQINQGSTSVWIAAAAVVVVWGLVALMVVAGIFLYLERPTLAQQPPANVAVPAVSVQPTTDSAGSPLTVVGQGWAPGSLVSIYLLAPGQTQTPNFASAQATADGQGNFTANVAIPSGGAWETPGTATVITRLASGGASAQTTFNLSTAPQAATQTPIPTETPTLTPTTAPAPASTEAPGSTAPMVTSKTNLNVRSGPGVNYPIVGVLLTGQSAEISGVSADGGWWQILFPGAPGGVGWVSAPFVTSQNTGNVPVVAAPPAPQPTATPVPLAAAAQPPTAIISGPGQAGQNQSIVFDGNSSTASAGHNIVGFVWSFGDGATANGSSVSHSYGSSGTFIVSLTVTDDLGQTGTATLTIQITAQGPTAQFDAPKEGAIGQSINFDAGDSHAASGHSIVDYDWNFDDGHSDSGSSPDHTFNKTGTFDVRLRVTDDQGLTSEIRHHITIEGLPTAAISGPGQGTVGQSLGFSGSSNDDDVTSFEWNFGDGGAASGQNVSHVFAQPGNFVITLTIFDDEGASATTAQVVTINPLLAPPTAFISGPGNGTVNQSVNFDGSGSTAGSGSITSYAWDFGDGSTGTGAKVSHTYTKSGTFTVLLTVTNSNNLTDQAQHSITIAGLASPKAVISGPSSGTENQAVNFDGSGSTAGSGSITSYAWDFGDGNNGSGATVSHTYTKAGKYAVILTVTNSNNLTDSVKHTITIGTVVTPPKAVINGPSSGTENQAVSFDGSKSDPGSGSITSYAWDFGDGNNGSGATVNHTYTKAGTYAVILTVTNSDNLTSSVKHTITIAAQQGQQQGSNPPTAVISGPSTGTVGKGVNFSANGSQAGAGSKKITSVVWDFGDGTKSGAVSVNHTYKNAGTYVVTLKVTNSSNLTDQATHSITIAAKQQGQQQGATPPTAVISGPSSGKVGKSLSFSANSSQVGFGSAKFTKVVWSFGDGGNASGAKVSHKYSHAGTYTVTLTVTNSSNLSDSTTRTVTIS
jgi:PKD repeat protein